MAGTRPSRTPAAAAATKKLMPGLWQLLAALPLLFVGVSLTGCEDKKLVQPPANEQTATISGEIVTKVSDPNSFAKDPVVKDAWASTIADTTGVSKGQVNVQMTVGKRKSFLRNRRRTSTGTVKVSYTIEVREPTGSAPAEGTNPVTAESLAEKLKAVSITKLQESIVASVQAQMAAKGSTLTYSIEVSSKSSPAVQRPRSTSTTKAPTPRPTSSSTPKPSTSVAAATTPKPQQNTSTSVAAATTPKPQQNTSVNTSVAAATTPKPQQNTSVNTSVAAAPTPEPTQKKAAAPTPQPTQNKRHRSHSQSRSELTVRSS